jgi:hypothetical protein
MEQDKCPLCRDVKKGQRITKKCALGQMSTREAARMFNMSEADVEEHIYKHSSESWQPEETASHAYDRDYYVKRLESLQDDLTVWANEILDGEPTAENIRMATTLVKELRDTMRLLGEVTKILKDDEAQEAIAAVQSMRAEYLSLTQTIATQCCPDCRTKVVAAIKTQREMLNVAPK